MFFTVIRLETICKQAKIGMPVTSIWHADFCRFAYCFYVTATTIPLNDILQTQIESLSSSQLNSTWFCFRVLCSQF